MRVYHVETSGGLGPYQTTTFPGWATHPHRAPDHPALIDDALLFQEWEARGNSPYHLLDYRFGFSSQEQAFLWFHDPKENEALRRHGYSLVEYEVPGQDVIEGDKQLVFKPDRAKQVRRFSMRTLPAIADGNGNWR